MAWRAAKGSSIPVAWIWARITGPVLEVKKPPPPRAMRAPLLAAAITEGSSVAIGMRTSWPSITKLVAMPKGTWNIPITFSTIFSA